jgi:hypothetical protein
MRFPGTALSLFTAAFLSAVPLYAVEPTGALIETLPVGNGESIRIDIREAGVLKTYNFTKDGKTVTVNVRGLRLTTTDQKGNVVDLEDSTIAQNNVPVPVLFRNLTRSRVRVTLQQPDAPKEGASAKDKAQYCIPTCKLNPNEYKSLCPTEPDSGRCKPDPAAMGVCGTDECNAIRKECNGVGCAIDLYKALDACACSVTRTLLPSTFPFQLGDIRYVPAGESYVLESAVPLSQTEIEKLSRNVGLPPLQVNRIPLPNFEYPTVLFDASLFSRNDGLTKAGDVFRFLIEQSPAAPLVDTEPPTDPITKKLVTENVRARDPLVLKVGDSPTLTANQHTGNLMRVVVVPLDDTGVTNWRYLNPRNPACINCAPGGQPLPAGELPTGVVFHNRTQDRTFLVSMTLPANVATNAVETAFKCTAGQPCKITRLVPPQNTALFDASLLALFKNSLIKFDVSLLGETSTLGYPAAYLSLLNPFDENSKLAERPSSGNNFKTKLSLGGRVEPAFRTVPATVTDADLPSLCIAVPTGLGKDYKPGAEPSICAEKNPFKGGSTQAYRGSGSVNLTANLSDRADASVTLNFRDGNYGADIDKTAVSEYNVTIYGINGLSLKFGKADFLVPSSGIALSESGEGFLYSWRYFGLGTIIRRESDAGAPLESNRDRKDWFLQARSLPIFAALHEQVAREESLATADPSKSRPSMMNRVLTILRSADLVVVRGEDKKKELPANSLTYGGELFFAKPASAPTRTEKGTMLHNIFGGSLAAYQSRRSVDSLPDTATVPPCKANTGPAPSPFCDGRGNVWLFTLNWVPSMFIAGGTNAATTPNTVSFAIGKGTGNKPGTTTDEGFIGDSAGFAPDRLFLKSFIPKMNGKDVPYEAIGLANKRYMAVTYTNSEFSLLDLVASALRVPDDVNSRSTVISVRDYKLLYSENKARAAAREIDATFNIEVPKGVTFTFDVNRLDPSEAFKDRIKRSVWSFGANVTLSL